MHWIIPFLVCHVQGPIVMSSLCLLVIAEGSVGFMQREEVGEEGVTGRRGGDRRWRTDESAIVSVIEVLESPLNCPIFESWVRSNATNTSESND